MPEPRLVVAVGRCAISGGVFAGTYAGRNGIGDVLPIDVLVPGSPPRPEAIIEGMLVAVGRLAGRSVPAVYGPGMAEPERPDWTVSA